MHSSKATTFLILKYGSMHDAHKAIRRDIIKRRAKAFDNFTEDEISALAEWEREYVIK